MAIRRVAGAVRRPRLDRAGALPDAHRPMAVARLARVLRRPQLDRFDLLLLAVLTALSLWTLGLDLWQVVVHGRIWTGTEAVYQEDGMQSLMWIRGILEHGASPDLYVLTRTPADFFQPLLALSAGVAALGVAPYLALLLWKPVALLAIFLLARAYVYRLLPARWPRRAALTLALLYGWGHVIGDSWIVWWSWGYPFALIGLACAIGALLAYSHDRAAGRLSVPAALLGALASWLHPWQGETLIAILLGAEALMLVRRRPAPFAALAFTVALTALPLCYFALLVHFDAVWRREHEAALSTYPLSSLLSGFLLLLLPALLAYRALLPARLPLVSRLPLASRAPLGSRAPLPQRAPARSFLELTLFVWPLATAAVFALSEWQGSGSTHALLGVTIPLGVLAVQGVRALPWPAVRALPWPAVRLRLPARGARSLPALAVTAIAVLTVPGTIHMLKVARSAVKPRRGNANFIAPGESRALAFLARDPRPGGVLTRFYLGMVVPAQTGRQSYTGNCYWSEPACGHRSDAAEELLAGQLPPARARAFVLGTGARFVLGDCQSRNLIPALAPIVSSVHRFGCAAVYVIGPP